METCPSCGGLGQYDVGDPEDGVVADCHECLGTGQVEDGDEFIPERDAWTADD